MSKSEPKPSKFPEVIYCAHYDHSSEESPSLNACLSEKEAIETVNDRPVMVAQYKLLGVRRLNFKIEEE